MAACAVAWFFYGRPVPETYSKELLAALLSGAAISAGFLTTALSILLPIGGTDTGSKLHSNGLMALVYQYLRSAIWGCMALAGLCVFLFFQLPDGKPALNVWQSALLVAFSVYACASLLRIAEVLLNIFERMSQPEDKKG